MTAGFHDCSPGAERCLNVRCPSEAEGKGGANKKPLPGGERARGLTAGGASHEVATHCVLPTRLSFGTVHRKRRFCLSHLRRTLRPGTPALPQRASLDAV